VKIKLDARTIAALQLAAGKNEEIFWDSELENFGLRLRRRSDGSLSRTFTAQYRADGHQRRKTWAADKLTPAQARDAARKHLAQVELGRDPQAEKAAKRRQVTRTVRTVVATYLEARQSKLRPESFRIARLYLENPMYFGKLHPKAIDAVVRADVVECVRAIASRRSAPTAAAARRALSAFFSWAIAEGLLGDGANPVVGTRKPDDSTSRDHVPTLVELAAIWNACGDDDFGRIVRLLILLGNRRAEIGGLRWSELNLTNGVWVLPASRSKNRRSLTVVLPATALAIIASVPQTNRDHLFGDRAEAGFTGWTNAKAEMDRRLGNTVRPWRLHDLRRGVATGMIDLDIPSDHVEAVLNHYSGHRAGIRGVYNRSDYTRPITIALTRWAEHVLALVEGRESNVVTLQSA
jgi:integrase